MSARGGESPSRNLTAADALPCVVYAAKSSSDEKGSVEDQQRLVVERVEAEGGRFVAGDPFGEAEASAFRGERGPALDAAVQTAMDAAGQHGEAELWVYHSSRLARGDGRKGRRSLNLIHAQLLYENVQVRSVTDDEFVRNAMLVGVASEQNHKYSADLSAHVTRGLRAAFERGQRLGGPVPDGYRLVKDFDERGNVRRSYVRDPDRAAAIRRMFELSERGMGDASIARELNREGYRTRAGNPWARRRVQDTLTNAFYAGRVAIHRGTPDEDVRDGQHPALIEPERFDRIRALRPSRDRAAGSSRSPVGRPVSTYALAQLAVCGRCGSRMYATTSTYRRKDGTKRRSYICAQVKFSTGECDAPAVSAEIVEPAVIANLDRLLIDFDGWCRHVKSGSEHERRALAREVERAAKERDRAAVAVERTEARWQQYEAAGDALKAEAVLTMLVKAREAHQAAEYRLAATHGALASVPDATPMDGMLDFYSALRAAVHGRMEGADSLLKVNDALRDLFERFVLETTEDGVTVLPILRAEAAMRILSDEELWADHADVTIAGYATEPIKHPDGPAFKAHVPPEEMEEHLRRVTAGEEVEIVARLRKPPALCATDAEPIAPPLLRLEAPSPQLTNSHE